MSLTIFLALCFLGLDFMIYVLFKLLYGDRRGLIARRVAEQRKAAEAEAAGLIFFPAGKSVPPGPELHQSRSSHGPSAQSRKPFASSPFHVPLTSGRHQLR